MKNKILSGIMTSAVLISSATADIEKTEVPGITVYGATQTDQSSKDVTTNMDIITSVDIEEKNFLTVAQAINSVSGVNVVSNGPLGTVSSIFMRGFDNQRVLILVDGVNYNDITGISGARMEHLMVAQVEQIEILKGAQSGVWGADAVAGVINIITKKPKLGTHGNVNVEYGSYNTKKMSGVITHKEDKYDFMLGAFELKSEGFSAMTPAGEDPSKYEKDGYKNTTINAKVGYNFNDSNRIEFAKKRITTNTEYDNGGWGSTVADKANGTGYNFYTTTNFDSLKFKNETGKFKTTIFADKMSILKEDPLGYTTKFEGDRITMGAKTKYSYNNDSFIIVGGDKTSAEYENQNYEKLKSSAIYLTNSFKTGKYTLTQSLRNDKHNLFKDKTTGKVGIKYDYSKDLYFSANYGTGYLAPAFYKLFDSWAGNASLTPEETTSIDATIGYKANSFDSTFTVFHNKIKNMIEYNNNTYSYYNMSDDVILKGFEVKYAQIITDEHIVTANYTRTYATDENGEDLPRRSKDSIKVSYDNYMLPKTHINLNGEFVGDRKEYDYGTYNVAANTGNYAVFNSVINYDYDSKTKLYVKVDNILDKQYQAVHNYSTPGRSAYVGVKYTF